MKKVLLLCMLLTGFATVSRAQFSVMYNFADGVDETLTFDTNVKFRVDLPNGGFNNGWGDDALTTTLVTNYNNTFAFCTLGGHDDKPNGFFKNRWANQGIQNYAQVNGQDVCSVLSILNLRAGELVKIHIEDNNQNDGSWATRYIMDHSPNAMDNYPWGDYVSWVTDWTQEFIMKADGNLDLKLARGAIIKDIEIVSNYVSFNPNPSSNNNYRTHVGETINVTIPNQYIAKQPSGTRPRQAQPVVMFCGDIDGTNATINYTADESNNQYHISVSGFTGIEYADGYWEGGSIIIMLDQTMCTYTVPYKVNTTSNSGKTTAEFARWNFWQNPLKVGRSDQPTYASLLAHDIAESSYEKVYMHASDNGEPLFHYKNVMNGQNPYFHPETAGLIFEAGEKGYAVLNDNSGDEPDGNRYIALKSGGSMTIPELQSGDEVWVYIDHYGNANGFGSSLGFSVTNATDAIGKTITQNVVTGGSTWGPTFFSSNKETKTYVGAMHFFSTGGDMKFTFFPDAPASCFAKIAYVRIVKHNEQGIITKTNSILWYNGGSDEVNGYELMTTQDAAGNYTTTKGSFGMHECGRGSQTQKYKVLEASGTLSKDDINNTNIDGVIGTYKAFDGTNCYKFRYSTQAQSNFGSFLLRGYDYDFNDEYCFDYADRVVAVGFRQTMNYPYTWDFTDILDSSKGNSQGEYDAANNRFRPEGTAQASMNDGNMTDTTAVWVKYNDVISLQNNRIAGENNRTLSSGTQLFADNTYIEEAAGLGWATINMDRAFNGSIQIIEDGVKVQTYNGWETRLFIPTVNKKGRIYLRGKKLNDGMGFVAKAYKNAELGPNTFRRTPDTRVDLTALTVVTESAPIFRYDGNFNSLIEEPVEINADKNYDQYMSVKATASNKMEEISGSERSVNNANGLFTQADHEIVTETRDDGNGGTVEYVVSDNGIYLNDVDFHEADKKILYDRNVVLCNDYDNEVYAKFINTKGSGKSDARTIQITMPNEGQYKVTIVARSAKSRQINIFAGDWSNSSSNALATMIVRDALMAKTIENTGNVSKITICSDNSGVEIYAIYVEEIRQSSPTDPEDYSGYVDVAETDGGVTLYLNDIIIEKIGYSTDVKTLNSIGWASESRDHYIDHSLTKYFTTAPVDAYMATGTATGDNNLINAVSLTKLALPMELSTGNGSPSDTKKTGCILYNSDKTAVEGGVYLFVPAIHDYLNNSYITNANFKGDVCTNGSAISTGTQSSDNADATKINTMDGNMMIANLSGDTVTYSGTSADYINYVLSSTYTDPNDVTHPTADEEAEERFVRVGTSGATGKANTAYLQLPLASVKPEGYTGSSNLIIIFDEDNQGGEADGIENIDFSSNGTIGNSSGNDSFYTITGQKVDNITKPGIYVKNGKKVLVK